MHSKDSSSASDKTMGRVKTSTSTMSSIQRSVSGMKNLLPFRLLSPTVPEFESCPAPTPSTSHPRSAFRLRIPVSNSDQNLRKKFTSRSNRQSNSGLCISQTGRYRDTPVYNEPASPLPTWPYFNSEDTCLNTPPASACDTECVVGGYRTPVLLDGEVRTMLEHTASSPDIANASGESYVTDATRDSPLSYQCIGEPQFINEHQWLSSPLDKSAPQSPSMSSRYNVESWLSDATSSTFEQDVDYLSFATALAPSKANLVKLSQNKRRRSDLSIKIPPRSSSFGGGRPRPLIPEVGERSWIDFLESPPITPSLDDEQSFASHQNHAKGHRPQVTAMCIDLALASPPTSPKRFPSFSPSAPNTSSSFKESDLTNLPSIKLSPARAFPRSTTYSSSQSPTQPHTQLPHCKRQTPFWTAPAPPSRPHRNRRDSTSQPTFGQQKSREFNNFNLASPTSPADNLESLHERLRSCLSSLASVVELCEMVQDRLESDHAYAQSPRRVEFLDTLEEALKASEIAISAAS